MASWADTEDFPTPPLPERTRKMCFTPSIGLLVCWGCSASVVTCVFIFMVLIHVTQLIYFSFFITIFHNRFHNFRDKNRFSSFSPEWRKIDGKFHRLRDSKLWQLKCFWWTNGERHLRKLEQPLKWKRFLKTNRKDDSKFVKL